MSSNSASARCRCGQPDAQKKTPDRAGSGVQCGSSVGRISRLVDRFEKAKRVSGRVENAISLFKQGQGDFAWEAESAAHDLGHREGELKACGALLWLRAFTKSDRVQSFTNRCRCSLLCASCGIIRAMKLCGKYGPHVEGLVDAGLVPYFLTLTVKDGPRLFERFQHFGKLWQALLFRRNHQAKYPVTAFRHVAGGVLSIEVTRGKRSGLWHPHGHVLLLAEKPIPGLEVDSSGAWRWPLLSDEVRQITGDSFIVECHPVDTSAPAPAADDFELLDVISGESVESPAFRAPSLRRAIAECLKYPLKSSSMSPEDICVVWSLLRGRRLIRSFGCLYGFGSDAPADDLLVDGSDDGDFVDFFFKWSRGVYSAVGYRRSSS